MSMADRINIALHSLDKIKVTMNDSNTSRIDVRTPTAIVNSDYNKLKNLPTINGVTVQGDLTYIDLFLAKQSIDTKAHWDNKPTYVPEPGEIVIYTDRNVINGLSYPGIKIGDGNAYLVDLPFLGDDVFMNIIALLEDHINNTDIHVTPEEKQFWNNKLNYSINNEILILNNL